MKMIVITLLFLALNASASTIKMLESGQLVYECERTSDMIVYANGNVVIPCGPNLILSSGVIKFSQTAMSFNYGTTQALPLVRVGGSNGSLSAVLGIDGPCALTIQAVVFDNESSVPQMTPVINAIPGVKSGACAVELLGQTPLTVTVVDQSCRP